MPTTRFAPSPSGGLHIGHAFSAWFARREAGPNGTMLLRIEDLDPVRSRPEHSAAIETDLAWLGFDWPRPARRQSEHLAEYRSALERLIARDLVYPCFCTRGMLTGVATGIDAPHRPARSYPGTCRNLAPELRSARIEAGASFAMRLDVARALGETGPLTWRDLDHGTRAVVPLALDDVVLARKDVPASYHLAVAWDDAVQGVEIVTRGEDLVESTSIHRLLQALLDLPVPVWRHHRLLVDAEGRRFAKRDGAVTLRALREAGKSPAEIWRLAGVGEAAGP